MSGALINQKPIILSSIDVVGVSSSPLNFTYRLFVGNYVPDITISKIQHFDLTAERNLPGIPLVSSIVKIHVLVELMQASKSYKDVILTSIARRKKVGGLTKMTSSKLAEASTSHDVGQDAWNNVSNDVEKDDKDIEAGEGGSEDEYESISSNEYED